jgi:hypothetical protein
MPSVDPETRGCFIAELTEIWERCLVNAIHEQDVKSSMALTLALQVLEETYVTNPENTGFVFVGERET